MMPKVLNPISIAIVRSWNWRKYLLWSVAAMVCLATTVLHAEATATASLSANTMSVGDSIHLTISIEGAREIRRPNQIDAPGLEITFSGNAQKFRSINGSNTFTIDLDFTVEAQKAGTYTVPSIEIIGDGKVLKTAPIILTVLAAPASAGGDDQMLFGEITMPKTKAYLGETIPVELKLYVDKRVRSQLEQMPVLDGDGFTKQKLPEPRQEQARRNGKEYNVIIFRTAITPSKAGKLIIGPAEMPLVAQLPQGRRTRPRSTLEELMGEAFSDGFFSSAPSKRMTIKAPGVELDVQPLPAAGRPKDFSGAVGSFKFSAAGTPRKVKVGDPITMKLAVSGRGNFDQVNAPLLQDSAGWHAYPPTNEVKLDDELGLNGTKTFEMAVIPEVKKTAMPLFKFSYFDPSTEKYVTLFSEAGSVEVEGGPVTPPATVPTASLADASENSKAAAPAPAAAPPQPADILGLNYDFGTRRSSFEPLYSRREFLAAQAIPAGALLVFLALKLWRRDEPATHLSQLRREKAALFGRLRNERSRADLFETAVQIIQMETSLRTGQPAQTVDAEAAIACRNGQTEVADGIQEIFSTRAELLYAGAGQGRSGGEIQEDERERVLSTLRQFEKNHGNS